MTALEVLIVALRVVGALLALALVLLVGQALGGWVGQRVSRRRLREARALLAGAITKRGRIWGGRFRRLPWDVQRRVFIEAGRALAGTDRRELRSLAQEAGLLDRAERECRRRGWSRRLHGARLFAAIGGGEGIMPRLLDDPHPMVRAEAIQWASHHPGLVPIERLLDRLGSGDPYERAVLTATLVEIGVPVVAPLSRHLAAATGAARAAGLEVAAGLGDGRFRGAALDAAHDSDPRVRARSAALFARIGGDDATPTLVDMLDDRASLVRQQAADALGRLRAWGAAPHLATLLDDNDRMVRQAAAMALHALGGPGRIVCRQVAASTSPRAAGLADAVLALPPREQGAAA